MYPDIVYAMKKNSPAARTEWVSYYEREGCSKADVCRRFKISRPTFDKWLSRWRRGHRDKSFEERPRTPRRSTRMLSAALQAYIRFLRGQLSKRKARELISGRKVRMSERKIARFRHNVNLLNEIFWEGRPDLKNRTSYRSIQKILRDDWNLLLSGPVPSIHAIVNACARRGKKYLRGLREPQGGL